jgi:hypothetical protein
MVVAHMNTVSYMLYEQYDEDSHRECDRMRFMLREYYSVMGLTEASFGCKTRGGVDDLPYVEEMLDSYNLSFLCNQGGTKPYAFTVSVPFL